jgi:3-oxoacyl-(acyl-carrier-protein) synthase
LLPSDIGYINAHGTGTANNDLSEGKAIMRLFGKNVPPVSSTKAYTGHATSAAGGIEAVIAILALQNDFAPRNLGFSHQMEELSFAPTDGKDKLGLRHVMSNSFGFGGNDTTLIFSKKRDVRHETCDVRPETVSHLKSHISSLTSPVYLQSAAQISIQQPLCEAWFDAPVAYDTPYVRAIDISYKEHLNPNAARRMGKILKRALVTARAAAHSAGIASPDAIDAIISGTGLGCIENTELFLDALVRQGESLLQPTHFMQSTHNTISSHIAIDMQCHGYNSTYAHKGMSFESALLDAFLQIKSCSIRTALVGGYDEMTPSYQLLLSRLGYWQAQGDGRVKRRDGEAFAGETSVSFVLGSERNKQTICQVEGVRLLYQPTNEALQASLRDLLRLGDIDAVMLGISGNRRSDNAYRQSAAALFPGKPLAGYKHIFGESYTASGLGLYAAATCLQRQRIPAHLFVDGRRGDVLNVKNILLYHQEDEGKRHSLVLLKRDI